ncbi:MAG: 30S ribosome-binding factor RbfA [gamma proteobacterium symbiont of Bathyaustriella thionipta]|nr:30S ribosome-binding factor RbfA [gamma proteobacterium symbiont of Bathyaustriella thionipta]MCU7949934.1 30S ribosome-binding factor RbfA [gamma proteobacterium symbiont of Bathyaustriella thionipta]MCU7954708.1 30S ribosome-binding factor RbfA [gamma proteobacterium symbiont of Bathyaustriella thionipta]MCU7956507.1 30S ribosome-binding factor RbfA [gamma proteobacterium symbiont of Bathyaustriella thionipta]MCU7966588.1 30S ribosome-binding factor RbfA [gamma proteobacterium symbiont of 
MPADFSRSRRVGELIQRELATLLAREVKDPRLSLISITAVDVTRDMGLAKVFYTVIDANVDDENLNERKKQVQEGLKKASGFLRYELGQRIKLRVVPNLDFRYDESVIRGAQLTQLIDNAIADDKDRNTD